MGIAVHVAGCGIAAFTEVNTDVFTASDDDADDDDDNAARSPVSTSSVVDTFTKGLRMEAAIFFHR